MIPQIARPAPPPIPIAKSKLLLAEGNTPMHFLEALLRSLGISDAVEIRNFGGLGDLKKILRALQASAGFADVESLGIVRDAEVDAARARQSVETILSSLQLPGVRTSVFILPDNSRSGMIEDLCLDSVRHEPIYACVEQFIACAESAGAPLAKGLKRSKSYAQAYLATREETQLFPGTAAYKDYWPFTSPAFDGLKAFLSAL